MLTRKLTSRALLAVAVAGTLALSGCVDSDRSQSGGETVSECPWKADDSIDAEVTIGWQRIPNGDLIVKDRGLLETCMPNATIKWVPYESGADIITAYAGGAVDLALVGNSGATIAMSPPNNADVRVVWIHDVIGQAESLVAKDPAAKSLEDLKGKTIGVPFGSTAHYSLLQGVLDLGLDPNKDFKIINLEPEGMPATWKSGDIDAAWVWEPTQSQLLKDGGHRILTSEDTAKAGYPTFDLGTADGAFVDDNPEFMAQWATAQDYAVKMISDDPDEAVESIAAVLTISTDDVTKQLEGYTYLPAEDQASADYLGGQMATDLTNTAKFLITQGSIDKALTKDQYGERVDPTPAEGVL